MKKLTFKIDINAPKEKVWELLMGNDNNKEWLHVSWPGTYSEGIWNEGENIRFLSGEGQDGTLMNLVEYRPYSHSFGRHIAVINADGTEDRTSEMAKLWIGSTEDTILTEKNGITTVTIEMQTPPEWESMFNDGWPNALEKLKEVAEQKQSA